MSGFLRRKRSKLAWMIVKRTAVRLKARRLMSPKPSNDLDQAATVGTPTVGADSTVVTEEVDTAIEAVPHEGMEDEEVEEEVMTEAEMIEVMTIVGVHREEEAEVRQGEEVEVRLGDETILSRGEMIGGAMIMRGGMIGERIEGMIDEEMIDEEMIDGMIGGMIGGMIMIDGIDGIR